MEDNYMLMKIHIFPGEASCFLGQSPRRTISTIIFLRNTFQLNYGCFFYQETNTKKGVILSYWFSDCQYDYQVVH